jgi:hypothetical protein
MSVLPLPIFIDTVFASEARQSSPYNAAEFDKYESHEIGMIRSCLLCCPVSGWIAALSLAKTAEMWVIARMSVGLRAARYPNLHNLLSPFCTS